MPGPRAPSGAGDATRRDLIGRVNLDDFNVLAANFGQSPRDFTQADFNYDGVVNLKDFNILAGRFGSAPTSAFAREVGDRSGSLRDARRRADDSPLELLP